MWDIFDPMLMMDPAMMSPPPVLAGGGMPMDLGAAWDAQAAAPLPTDIGAAWDAQAAAAPGAAGAAARGNPFGLSDKEWAQFYTGLRSLGGGVPGAAGAAGSSMPNSSNYMRSGFAAPASAGGPPNLLMSLMQMHQNNAARPQTPGRMSLLGG